MATTEETQYIENCEILVKARTEQLRDSVKACEVLLRALDAVTKAETLADAKRIAQTAFDNRR